METFSIAAVGIGAAAGAWLRWFLGIRLNSIVPTLPLGTVAANLIGGFLVGVAVAWFERHPQVAPQARLFVITGFMGGLTTFSTFSAEVVGLLLRREYAWALGAAGVHLLGSLLLTGLGIALVALLSKAAA
jgi:CrcB protein